MKRLIAILGAGLLILSGCESSHDHSDHSHGEEVSAGTATAKLMIHVEGQTPGSESQPLSGAAIYLSHATDGDAEHHHHPDGDAAGTTDEYGNAVIDLVADREYVVHVRAEGFETLVRLVQEPEGAERHLWLTSIEQHTQTLTIPESGEVSVTLGNTLGGSESPVTLTIEAGDLGTGNGEGEAISGDIEITYGSWDPSVDDPSSLPSDLLTADGPLLSYGMFHIEFIQDGEVLNVRPDETISWTMQINESMRGMATQAAAMDTLNIYSLDHNTGLWVQDEVARSFDAETGIVSSESEHFSHKNVDQPGPFPGLSCLDIRVVNRDGDQIAADVAIAGRGGAGQGCTNLACEFNGGANQQVRYTVTARHNIEGTNTWLEGSESANTKCDDIAVGCGTGACADVEIMLCSPEQGACNSRSDCCDGLGCFAGVCQPCMANSQTCDSDDHCCGGLNCLDSQCFAN